MRHDEATRVTSLMYLTPIFAVVLELLVFGVVPTPPSLAGIAGVAMVAWAKDRPAAAAVD
jgi:drug/metabolite transporter (DMT)-like permease